MEIVEVNRKGLWMATLPYKLGMMTAVTVAFGSIPMIFELNTVLWFNELYVTTGKWRFLRHNSLFTLIFFAGRSCLFTLHEHVFL